MENIFKSMNVDGELSSELINEILKDQEEAKRQVDIKIEEISSGTIDIDKEVSQLCELYNNFSDENEFTKYLIDKLYDFYLDNIDKLIVNQKYFSIYRLMDLFNNNNIFQYYNIGTNEMFIERTLPILSVPETDSSSFISIASLRFIGLLSSESFVDNGKEYLRKYLNQENLVNDMYIDEIKKVIG